MAAMTSFYPEKCCPNQHRQSIEAL